MFRYFYRLHVSGYYASGVFVGTQAHWLLATQKKYVPLIPVDLGGESSCR